MSSWLKCVGAATARIAVAAVAIGAFLALLITPSEWYISVPILVVALGVIFGTQAWRDGR